MPWSNQNGGGGSGGPWGNGGGGRNGGPWGQGPQKSGPNPPDLEDMIRKGQERLRQAFPGGGGSGGGSLGAKGIGLLALGAVAVWMLTGFYSVKEGELALNCCSQTSAVSGSGLNYNFPTLLAAPKSSMWSRIREINIGARQFSSSRGTRVRTCPKKADADGDENIIDVDFKVQ